MNDIPRIPFILNSNVLLYCIKCRLMLQMQRISNECFFLWFLCVIVDVYDLINLWGILLSTGLSSKECLFQFLKLIHLISFDLHYRELYEIRSLTREKQLLLVMKLVDCVLLLQYCYHCDFMGLLTACIPVDCVMSKQIRTSWI